MKNVFFKLVTTAAAASLVLAALPVSADEEAKEIKVAVAGGFYPITYADDNGEAQGYDVEVFKAVDELLPQYTFTYEITDKETMNVGVQSGTYQVGINSLFKNDARTCHLLYARKQRGIYAGRDHPQRRRRDQQL